MRNKHTFHTKTTRHQKQYNMDDWGRKTEKQLGYIMISREHKNWMRYAVVKGVANDNQRNHRRIAQVDISINIQRK